MKRRVAITGVGVVTPFGCNLHTFWDALRGGLSGVRSIDQIEGIPVSTVAGAVVDFSPAEYVDAKASRLMSPAVMFGVAAAKLAVDDAGLAPQTGDPTRIGAFVGSRGHSSDRRDLMNAVTIASQDGSFRFDRFGKDGLGLVHPMWLLKGLANNVLYFVSLKYNLQGMNNNISMGGVAATLGIGEAFRTIQHGQLDTALAGGYDSALDAERLETFRTAGLVTESTDPENASRPFDRGRTGFVPSEGAAFIVLEALDIARARGAHIYGEVLGYGSCGSGLQASVGPSEHGFAEALALALTDAGVETPDAVFAHGLATRATDAAEARGIQRTLGHRTGDVPVSALKSMLGNTVAGSGTIEAVAALFALAEGAVPPIRNLVDADDGCGLDYVAGHEARVCALHTVALNNANLAGAHAALVLGRVS